MESLLINQNLSLVLSLEVLTLFVPFPVSSQSNHKTKIFNFFQINFGLVSVPKAVKNYKQFKTFKRNGGNLFRCSNKCIPKMLYRASCVTCWKRLHQDLFLTWLKMVPHLIYQCLYWFIILDSLGKLIHKKLET